MPKANPPQPLLSFKLDFDDSVELDYLAGSCLAFSREFAQYSKRHHAEFKETRQSLRVTAVRSGSIELELAPFAAAVLADPEHLKTCLSCFKYIKVVFDYLKGELGNKEKPELTKKTLNNINSIISPVANGNATQLNVTAKNINVEHLHVHFNVDKPKAKQMTKSIAQEKMLLDTGDFKEYKAVELQWYQARNDISGTGDRAAIKAITNKKLKVTFKNEADKQRILSNARNPFSGTFTVDVTVHFKEGKASSYHVTKIHD